MDVKFDQYVITGKSKVEGLYIGYKKGKIKGTVEHLLFKIILKCGLGEERHLREVYRMIDVNQDKKPPSSVVRYRDSGEIMHEAINEGVKSIYIVMPKHSEKTLEELSQCEFDEKSLIDIMRQLLEGLQHIHDCSILHRNLEPKNVFLEEATKSVTIHGFGLSKKLLFEPEIRSNYSAQTAREWSSPEMLSHTQAIDKSTDVFSLGLLFYYILSRGHHAFGEKKESREHYISLLDFEPNLDKPLLCIDSDAALDLIRRMISKDAVKRPSIAEVKNHCIFWSALRKINSCTELYRTTEKDPNNSGKKGLLHTIDPVTGEKNCYSDEVIEEPDTKCYKCPSTEKYVRINESNWTTKLSLSEDERVKFGIPDDEKECITDLLELCGKVPYYQHSTYSLLRFMRHRAFHSDSIIVGKIMNNDEEFWNFFSSRFPKLLKIAAENQ